MTPELEKKIQDSIAAVGGLFKEKQIEANQYYKCLVCLAYEFSVQAENLRAAALLQGVPLEYFRDVQKLQMVEDGDYAYISYTLALNLVQGGLVHLGPQLSTNVPAASA